MIILCTQDADEADKVGDKNAVWV